MGFKSQLQTLNENVRLDHIFVSCPKEEYKTVKPMIVLHGLLGGMKNWRSLCQQDPIISKRECYLLDQRNHCSSDHHPDMNYEVLSDDIIRFADNLFLEKFTVLGHSMGGKTAMTVACRYPDRVDGVISVDSAPVSAVDSASSNHVMSTTQRVVSFMYDLER